LVLLTWNFRDDDVDVVFLDAFLAGEAFGVAELLVY